MKKRNPAIYINDIFEQINKAISFTNHMDFNDFRKDEKTQYAEVRALEIIGEAGKKIPDEITNKYNDIPWKEIKGMRDILIHEYFGVNTEIIWKTIKEDLPELRNKIKKIIDNFNSERLNL